MFKTSKTDRQSTNSDNTSKPQQKFHLVVMDSKNDRGREWAWEGGTDGGGLGVFWSMCKTSNLESKQLIYKSGFKPEINNMSIHLQKQH